MAIPKSIESRKFIVVGGEHYGTLGAVRSLGEAGIKPVVFLKPNEWKMTSRSKYIGELIWFEDHEDMAYKLLDHLEKNPTPEKPFLVVCGDESVFFFDENYDVWKELVVMGNAGHSGDIVHYSYKETLNELAGRHGLQVAKTWDVVAGKPVGSVEYPVITKPKQSYAGWKSDYYICKNEAELKEALRKIEGRPVFLQRYVKKVNELCLDGIVINQGKDTLITMASTYTHILPDYYSNEMVISSFDNKELRHRIEDLFSEIGYEGIFSLEFLVDANGELWFLEINFRHSGWSYASTCLGMNLPILWAQGTTEGRLPEGVLKTIPEGYTAMAEIPDFWQRVIKHKMINPLEWALRMCRTDCLFIYNSKDRMPGISGWSFRIKSFLGKKLKRR